MKQDNFLLFLDQEYSSACGVVHRESIDRIKAQYILEREATTASMDKLHNYFAEKDERSRNLLSELNNKQKATFELFKTLLQQKDAEIQNLATKLFEISAVDQRVEKEVAAIVDRTKELYGYDITSFERLAEVTKAD